MSSTQLLGSDFFQPAESDPALLAKKRLVVSDVHNATCNAFAQIGLPLKLRAVACAIIAAANGEKSFAASYTTLVDLLFRHGDGRTFEAKKSEVRRLLAKLHEWQEKTDINLCTIRPGGITKDERGEKEYHDTEFDLVLLDAIAKALLSLPNPTPDKMRAAVHSQVCAMMKVPAFDARWTSRAPTPEELQRRERKAAVTMACKAAGREETLHGDPYRFAVGVALEILEEARAKWGGDPLSAELSKLLTVAGDGVSLGGGCVGFDTPPPVRSRRRSHGRDCRGGGKNSTYYPNIRGAKT